MSEPASTMKVVSALPPDVLGRRLMTQESIVDELGALGVGDGATICAHVSLKSMGYVCGGAETVIAALLRAVGSGTVMMPSFSGEHSDPAEWKYPPAPEAWIEPIRAAMPPYDPARTPSRLMGTVAELMRTWPGTLRSPHPQSSFIANGSNAVALVSSHPYDYRFGLHSPLAKLAALDGQVLLLGAGDDRASFIYLAQFMAGIGVEVDKAAPVLHEGHTEWVRYRDMAVDNRLVSSGVRFLLRQGIAKAGAVGNARTLVFPCRLALQALLEWMWRDTDFVVSRERSPCGIPENWRVLLDGGAVMRNDLKDSRNE